MVFVSEMKIVTMKKIFFSFLIIALVILSYSCQRKKKVVPANSDPVSEVNIDPKSGHVESGELLTTDTLIYYQRGACFGMCPIFNLTIYNDGHAIYEGKNFVDHIGFYRANVDPAALQKITDVAGSIGYFSMEEKYDNPNVTDLPSTRTGIAKDGKLKMVTNRYKGPKSLLTLYNALDTMIIHTDWKPSGN
jgi:hypothetical protein